MSKMKCRSMLPTAAIAFVLSVVAGPSVAADLPTNYTRLDWIESTASAHQWIDTAYNPQATTVIRASVLVKERAENWSVLFGMMKDDASANSVVFRYNNGNLLNALFANAQYSEANVDVIAGNEYAVELKSGSVTVTGTPTNTKTITTVNEPAAAPIYLFCQNNYKSASNTSSPNRYQPMRLYAMTIAETDGESEIAKRDFVPCIDDTGAYGLWDKVEGVFYGNRGSGSDFLGGVIYTAAANEQRAIPEISGTAELRGEDAATSEFDVASVAEDSLVYVANATKRVTLGSVAGGVKVVVRNALTPDASVTLALPEGEVVASLTIPGGVTVCLESGSVGSIEGAGRLVVRGDAGYGMIADTLEVVIENGASFACVLDAVLPSVLGDLPALWLDASETATFQEYTYNGHTVPEGTFPGMVVRRWNDRRAGENRAFAVSARSSTGTSDGGYIRTMPYLLPNKQNGLTVLSFGTRGGQVKDYQDQIGTNGQPNGGAGGHNEQRRMIFSKPIAAKTIVMVYGSQDGGGMGLVGGWKTSSADAKNPAPGEEIEDATVNTATYYNRDKATTEATVIAPGRKNVPCWIGGEAIVPNETAALNGGYQVISLGVAPGDSPSVRSIGMADEVANAGGQRYGEILVFTNELTSVQRKAVEYYLAKKWGLLDGYNAGARPKTLSIAEGGSFGTCDTHADLPRFGGTLTVGGALEASGVAVGSVTVCAGAKVTLPAKDVWTEAEVDAVEGRIGRFDPDCTADVGFNVNNDMVHALFNHGQKGVAGSVYLQAYYRDASNDRRPTYVRSARGFGPERGWMDLNADPPGQTVKGNNLRFKTNHDHWKGDNGDVVKQNVKTAFIVMDSCHGGGLPIIDAVSPGTLVKARSSYTDYTAPIWGSGTSKILTGGETRLNGRIVDGTKTGFTGAPELFSFTTDGNDFGAGFCGFYNAGGDKAYEVLGEMVFFDTVLDDATRSGIESYLMKKWLDMLPPGYADWTRATVGGAGTVVASRTRDLPAFDGFTGTLELASPSLSFTLDAETQTAVDAIDLGEGTLRLASEGEISLSFVGDRIRAGDYVLASFGSLAEPGIVGWTYPALAGGKYKVRIVVEDGALIARIVPPGMCVIVQ